MTATFVSITYNNLFKSYFLPKSDEVRQKKSKYIGIYWCVAYLPSEASIIEH
jgi:hypothetical protein